MAAYGSQGPWNENQMYAPPGSHPYGVRPKNEPLAGWSLGLSIFSLMCCAFAAPVAIVMAINAQRRIDASGGYLTGRGMATAGLVIGILGCVAMVLNLVVIASGGGGVMWYGS